LYILVKMVRDLPGYFAERLYHSMKGPGTSDNGLMRIVVTRSEVGVICYYIRTLFPTKSDLWIKIG